MKPGFLALVVGLVLAAGTADAQVLFDFNGGPQYSGTPLDQFSGGLRAHFTGGYSIQDIQQVIGVLPTGFSGLGLSPNSVFGSDLGISFFKQSDGSTQTLQAVSILVAPQELSCDSSSTMRITAYNGATFVGSQTAVASLDSYTWPMISLGFVSAQPFDNVVVHFEAGPPTGGDWGGIFVADNLSVTPTPEPASLAAMGLGLASMARRLRRR